MCHFLCHFLPLIPLRLRGGGATVTGMAKKSAPAEPTETTLSIRLPRDLHAALRARAAQEDRSVAATIRRACYHYLGVAAPGGEG